MCVAAGDIHAVTWHHYYTAGKGGVVSTAECVLSNNTPPPLAFILAAPKRMIGLIATPGMPGS